MSKLIFTFFEVMIPDDDVIVFVQKMEEVLKKFAGGAYHFRYYIENPPNKTRLKPERDWLEKP